MRITFLDSYKSVFHKSIVEKITLIKTLSLKQCQKGSKRDFIYF